MCDCVCHIRTASRTKEGVSESQPLGDDAVQVAGVDHTGRHQPPTLREDGVLQSVEDEALKLLLQRHRRLKKYRSKLDSSEKKQDTIH